MKHFSPKHLEQAREMQRKNSKDLNSDIMNELKDEDKKSDEPPEPTTGEQL